jgi:hypothetical protein
MPLLLAILSSTFFFSACPDETIEGQDAGPTGSTCVWDEQSEPENAAPLSKGQDTRGYLCPVEDKDWYSFDLGADEHVVSVSLKMDGSLSPVEVTYGIFAKDEAGQPVVPAAAFPPSSEVGGNLDLVHCTAPGSYLLVVNDQGDDAQDIRREYILNLTTSPDPDSAEPNDDQAGAMALTSGTAHQGAVACRGDEDWFSITVPDGNLLRMRLDMGISKMEPTLELRDSAGELITSQSNLAGTVEATAIDLYAVVPASGTYYVVVADDDRAQADVDVTYSLTVDTIADLDPNEPNNSAATATELAANPVPCGAGWSNWMATTGTIGAPGDPDWFRIPVSGCTAGVVEVEMTINGGGADAAGLWALQEEVQANVQIVRGHTGTPCTADTQCNTLNISCNEASDCAGYFDNCTPQGVCAGASACLGEGNCGGIELDRHYDRATTPGTITDPPPPNQVRLAAPILGDDVIYVRAGDFQSNGAAPDYVYDLRVRIRADSDTHEPNNVYMPSVLQDFEVGLHTPQGTGIPIHDCVNGDCCGPGTWVEGALSYENDFDFYRYQHPCPGLDCMVRIVYDFDGGPVDFFFNVYRGNSLWFDNVITSAELGNQSAVSGAFGGLDPSDECFYAYQGHSGNPFYYNLLVRDLAEVRDWDSEQAYRFCVEKISDQCVGTAVSGTGNSGVQGSPCIAYEHDDGSIECNSP